MATVEVAGSNNRLETIRWLLLPATQI